EPVVWLAADVGRRQFRAIGRDGRLWRDRRDIAACRRAARGLSGWGGRYRRVLLRLRRRCRRLTRLLSLLVLLFCRLRRLRQRARRRHVTGLGRRTTFFSGRLPLELLEAELVVVVLLLNELLHLGQLELQALDLSGERAHLVLELLHLHGE